MNKTWAPPLSALFIFGLLAVFLPQSEMNAPADQISSGDVAWMLTASGLVLLMTPGLSFFYGGMVGARNIISTMLQSFVAMGVVSILWIVAGFSIAFGPSLLGLFGNPFGHFLFRGVGLSPEPAFAATIPFVLFALFQLKFAIITPALITGSFAERVRFSSYLVFISLYSLLIYAPVAHWTWHPNGFLRQWGVMDFAGGTVVHMSAGLAALAGALVLGRRRTHLDGETHVPSNIPLVILGTGMLWFGWFGFNSGSALAANQTACLAFLTTNTASAAAMLTWMFFDGLKGHKPSAMGACIGAVVGLVAITPAAGYVSVGASILIGGIAAVISNVAVSLRTKSALDDTLDVFPCHGVGGIVGMILTAVFADKVGLIHGSTALLGYHLLAMVIVAAYTFAGSYILYKVTDRIIPLRVSEDQERLGLDLSQHGESVLHTHVVGGETSKAVLSALNGNGNGHGQTKAPAQQAANV